MNTSTTINEIKPVKKHATAVVLHLYYTELFSEVQSYLDHLDDEFDLFLSLTEDQSAFAKNIRTKYPDASILIVPNHGRDLAPFLEFLKIIVPLGYETLLKVHTKKTLHREDGTTWRKDVLEKLLGSKAQVSSIQKAFASDGSLAMLGPQDHVIDSRFYMGKNAAKVQDLLYRCGFAQNLPESFFFVASTMFWARPDIFKPLLKAGLSFDNFEHEPLPVDGSLAHALERFFGLLVEVQGKKILSINADGRLATPDSFDIYPFATPPDHLRLRNLKSVVFYRAYEDAYAIEYLRVTAPFRAAGVQVIDGGNNPELASQADAVIFQREFPKNLPLYDQIIYNARAAGKFVLYEIDDLLFDLPESHPERTQELYNAALMPMMAAMIDADLVLVPTDELCKVVKGFNPNIVVLPNYLDDKNWQLKPPVQKSSDEVITIGYMGSNSHTPDLSIVASVLRELLTKYERKLKLEVWGTPLPGELQDVEGVSWHPSPTNIYTDFVKFFQTLDFDLVIAPLADNLFNRCKSNLKFLEYSAIGAPGVYSQITPYEGIIYDGVNGFLAGDDSEWVEKLTRLIENPDLRYKMAVAAQKTVQDQWLLSGNIHSWEDIYNKLSHEIFSEDPNKALQAHVTNTISRQLYHDRVNADARYQNLVIEVSKISEQNADLSNYVQYLNQQFTEKDNEVIQLKGQLDQIYSSREWKAVMAYRQGRAKLSRAIRKVRNNSGPISRFLPSHQDAHRELILSSGLFEVIYYLRLYPDVRDSGVDPVIHYLDFGGVEGRNPSPEFDSTWYLDRYPDVRAAGINPLLHYLRFGRQEGRTYQSVSNTRAAGQIPESKADLIPGGKKVPEKILLIPQLKLLLEERLLPTFKIALSHDDYLNITGGAQVALADEQRKTTQSGLSYLHIFPFTKRSTLADENAPLYLGINLDGKHLGNTEADELITTFRELNDKQLVQLSIHHSMGLNFKTLQALLNLANGKGSFWLHDYFSICPSYNLRRNDKEYCGAPDIHSNSCRLCCYLEQRTLQMPIFEQLFKDNHLEVVAPSQFVYDLWQSRFPVEASAHIIPPARLNWQKPSYNRYISGSLRVGFLGYPIDYKGWHAWMKLVEELDGDHRYNFYHFSSQTGQTGNYKRIGVQVTEQDRLAMIEALRWNQIDVAFLWSTVAETFSFTLHEALAAGCFILTNPKSGNIQDYIRRNPNRGLVLADEEALKELFETGALLEKVREYQKAGKPQAHLVFGSLEEIKP